VTQLKTSHILYRLRDNALLAALAALTVILVALCWLWIPEPPREEWGTWIAEEGRLLEQTSSSAREAITAEAADFGRLRRLRDRLEASARRLETLAAPRSATALRRALADEIPAYREALTILIDQGQPLQVIARSASQLWDILPRVDMAASRLAQALIDHRQPGRQIYLVSQLSVLAGRIDNHLLRLLGPGTDPAAASDAFGRDVALFGRILKTLTEGDKAQSLAPIDHPKARAKVLEIEALYPGMEARSERLLRHVPALVTAHQALGTLLETNRRVQQHIDGMLSENGTDDTGSFLPAVVTVLGTLLFAGAGLLIWRRGFSRVQEA